MTHVVLATMLAGWASGRVGTQGVLFLGAVIAPELTAVAAIALVVIDLRRSRGSHTSEVLLLVRLAAELRAGATLRAAIGDVAEGVDALSRARLLAGAGRPMDQVLAAARPALGRYGDITAAALGMASSTGGSVAPVVEQLVAQVMALDELHRERRAAMAPVLLQAFIVGGGPLVTLVVMIASGRLVDLAGEGPVQAGIVVTGSGLVAVGSLLVARIALRRVAT